VVGSFVADLADAEENLSELDRLSVLCNDLDDLS
jgi:hypothetical protein